MTTQQIDVMLRTVRALSRAIRTHTAMQPCRRDYVGRGADYTDDHRRWAARIDTLVAAQDAMHDILRQAGR